MSVKPLKAQEEPSAIDAHVGMRLRLRRQFLQMSRDELGRLLGTSTQELVKYELGERKISAERLYQFARKLEVPITWFYDGATIESQLPSASAGKGRALEAVSGMLSYREGVDLLLFYFDMLDAPMRRKLIEVARVLADEPGNTQDRSV